MVYKVNRVFRVCENMSYVRQTFSKSNAREGITSSISLNYSDTTSTGFYKECSVSV